MTKLTLEVKVTYEGILNSGEKALASQMVQQAAQAKMNEVMVTIQYAHKDARLRLNESEA